MNNSANLSTNRDGSCEEALTVGVEKERVDPETLRLIHALFGKRGIEFLSLALGRAIIKQLSLPGLEDSLTDVAVIQATNLRSLAKAIGWCYDAVDKYVLLFCALQFLRKSRSRSNGTELHFPLTQYHPDTAVINLNLGKLYGMRPKVASLARKVAGRLSGLTPSASSLLSGSGSVSQKVARFDLPGAIQDISTLLSQVLDSHQRGQLLPQIEAKLRYRCQLPPLDGDESSTASSEQAASGDFLPVSSVEALPASRPPSQKGATSAQEASLQVQEKLPVERREGDFLPVSSVEALSTSRPSSQKGATPVQVQKRSPYSLPTGNLLAASSVETLSASCPSSQKGTTSAQEVSLQVQEKLPCSLPTGNFLPADSKSTLPETGDFSSDQVSNGQLSSQALKKSPETGDFSETGATSLNANVIENNSNNSKKDDSVNDAPSEDRYTPREAARVGQQLAYFLEKSPENIGGFVNKAKACSRTVVRAAIVEILVHTAFPKIDPADERGRPKHRGRWFHDSCNRYSLPGSHIPAYVLRWVKTDLSWEEIERELNTAALSYQGHMAAGGNTANLVRRYLRGEIDKQALDQALQTVEKPTVVTGATGSARPVRMIEWKGRMVTEEQAYEEGYFGGFERFLPGDHPADDLEALVKKYQAEGKLPIPAEVKERTQQ